MAISRSSGGILAVPSQTRGGVAGVALALESTAVVPSSEAGLARPWLRMALFGIERPWGRVLDGGEEASGLSWWTEGWACLLGDPGSLEVGSAAALAAAKAAFRRRSRWSFHAATVDFAPLAEARIARFIHPGQVWNSPRACTSRPWAFPRPDLKIYPPWLRSVLIPPRSHSPNP